MANTSESKSSSARKERRKEWWMKKNNSKKAESGEGIKLRVRQPKTETDRQASVIETQHGFKLKLKLNSNNTSLPKVSRKTLKPPAKPRAKAAPPKATSTALSSKPPSTTKKKEPKAKASDVIANTCATPDPIKPKTYILFVGNLPFDVTKEQLLEHFRKTGGAKSVRIPKEKGTDKGRGFAYIQFRDHISFRVGLRLHQTTLAGRKINVEFTSIGGNNKNRREKLKAKNKALEKLKQSVDKDS